MADPLSVVAAVIGLAAIATKSTRAFLDIVSSARQVPHEIATTANDVRILHANLSFLVSLLNDREIEAALRSNKPLADLVSNLMHPLRDYERAVQKLTLKLRNVLSRKERSTLKPIARNLKFWIAAKDIRELRMNVEAAKSTLIMSLGAITLYCTIHTINLLHPLRGMPAQDSVSITRSTPTMLLKQSSIPPTHTEASLDEFLDCQSDQSSEYFEDAMDRFRTASSGSPASFFESSKSFFPEQYSYGQDSQFSIHASIQIQGQEHIQMIFITYAQTPRLLRRIKLAAVFGTPEMKPFQLQCSIYDHFETTPKTLPDDMTTALKVLLPGFSFHRAITNITIPFVRDHSGVIVPRIQELDVSRNELDTSYTREAEILRKVRALGLPVIQGSDIVIASRISTARFLVLVDSRPCMERRVSFAGAGDRGRDSLQEYWDDLEDLLSLSGCRHVLEFRGITLDEDGQHIRGYLHEFPNYKIEQALCTAAKQNRFVPWRFRERWAMELVSAVAEIHDKNLVAQVDDLLKIFIRADGSTAFPARIFPRYMAQRRYGHQAPERRTGNERLEAPTKAASFQSDIFTLGIILWGLAEHKGALYGTFCPRNGCTQSPKHACTALHANPIELPDCTSGIPLYYGRMIKKCRSFNPDERPTAKILLESFPYDVRFGAPPKGIHNVRTHYPPIHFGALCHCDECGALCSFDFYACDTCNIGFCPPCMTQSNLSCMQPGHRVVRQRLPAPTVSIMS